LKTLNNSDFYSKLCIFFISVFFLLPNCIGFSQSVDTLKNKKNILYINSYHIGYRWGDSITKGIESVISPQKENLYTEYLDAKRFGQAKFTIFAQYLMQKYSNTKFDGIIVSDNDALDFTFKYGDTLFPVIPIIFCGINNPGDYKFDGSRYFGIIENSNHKNALTVFAKLLPQNKSILFVGDNTTSGKIYKKNIKKLQSIFPHLQFRFTDEIDTDSLLNQLKNSRKEETIYLLGVHQDKYGNPVDSYDFCRKLCLLSPSPIFADDYNFLGLGIVGGHSDRGILQGNKAGLLVQEIINSTNRDKFVHVSTLKEEYFFDYKALKKFKIRHSQLPENSVIQNKPLVKYWRYIVFLAIVILFLSTAIIVLAVNIRKRYKAEKQVREQMLEIQDQNAQLEESYQQMSDMNCELEEINNKLSDSNSSLIIAKQKAEESEKLKSSFLANMSHEIRTPLNAIMGFSSLISDPDLDEIQRENYSSIINSSGNSLLVLIDDILDLSKIEAGQIQVNLGEICVNEVLNQMVQYFNPSSNKNKIEIRCTDFSDTPNVMLLTDSTRFKQIFTNLIANALKFTEKGFIELGFRIYNPDELIFYVKDSGIGIEKEYQSVIFDRFRKIDANSEKFYSGAGLGLAITKKLIELLGGKIWVESEPGKGATFFFTHPGFSVIQTSENLTKCVIEPRSEMSWDDQCIAIAEDQDHNFLLLDHIIKRQGGKTIRFNDGLSILEYFSGNRNTEIKIILMDIKMPGIDGFEAMERIKKLHPDIKIIAQTAHAMPEDINEFIQKGFDNYITKPINIQLLKDMLNSYLV